MNRILSRRYNTLDVIGEVPPSPEAAVNNPNAGDVVTQINAINECYEHRARRDYASYAKIFINIILRMNRRKKNVKEEHNQNCNNKNYYNEQNCRQNH